MSQPPDKGLLAQLGIGAWVARGSVEFGGPAPAQQPAAGDAGVQGRRPAAPENPAQARRPAATQAPSPSRSPAPDRRAGQGQEAAAPTNQTGQIWFCRADKGARALVVCLDGGDIGEVRARFLGALAVALDSVVGRDQKDEKGGKNGREQEAGGPRDVVLVHRPAADRSEGIPQITAAAEQVRGGAVLWLGPPLNELEDRCKDAGAAVLQGPPLDELMADPQKKRALWEQMRALKRD